MDLVKVLPILTGAIAVLTSAVGVAIYITRLRCDIQQSRVENELKRLQEQYSELETKHVTLLRAGNVAFTRKTEMDTELATIADAAEATASSILVPPPSIIAGDEPTELVFLSLRGPGAEKLKGIRVPLDSLAGNVFKLTKPLITHDPRRDAGFSAKADEVSKSYTEEMLALPLVYRTKCVGVVELLNKKGNRQFDLGDQQHVERLLAPLCVKVGEFLQDPSNFELLGITPKREAEDAAVLFSDLSGSSRLPKHLEAAVVIDLINEYFEALCSLGLSHGGTIDKFIGDGFMATFNVPKPVAHPELKAVTAAIEMQKSFDELKRKWRIFNIPDIYNRIGIAFGPVHRAEMGHSQYRHITVMGAVVNAASNLCELGPRDRNAILISEDLYPRLSSQLIAQELRPAAPREAKGAISKAYEVVSLK